MHYYLAIDIGASSGRHIVGWKQNGITSTKEVFLFPNGMQAKNGHLIWDVGNLVARVKEGIEKALETFPEIESLSIDTWGVDYVLMNGEEEIFPCYAYRDSRTELASQRVHEIIPFNELYRRTGTQYQHFNTVYQLYDDKLSGRLINATDFLMIPEYLLYKLCGVKSHEYTNATTSGMISTTTKEYDQHIIRKLGFPERLFQGLSRPGATLGTYNGIRCLLCATHDTASAVEGIPMTENDPYISSGTWSLIGVKTDKPLTNDISQKQNWSNEGGVEYNRYQKNIMGMWIVNRLRAELCPLQSFNSIAAEAEASRFDGTVDANNPVFMAPESMKQAFDNLLVPKPYTNADYFRCAYRSLARSYRDAIEELQKSTGRDYCRLVIVGGGAKNEYLNRLTAIETGKLIIAMPIEASALGNLKIQMEAKQ